MKRISNKAIAILLSLSVSLIVSCGPEHKDENYLHKDVHEKHERHEHDDEHGHEVHEVPKSQIENESHTDEGHDDHEGHAHAEQGEDLTRSVDALFSDKCEHDIKTHTCVECRYEVGVVKVPKEMVTANLITLKPAMQRPVTRAFNLTGEIQFDQRRVTHVSTQVSGIIKKVHVMLGDKVTAGQPLIELESVEVGNARATLQEAMALDTLARQNYERTTALRKEQIASEKEVLYAKQEQAAAQIRVAAAKGTLRRIGTGEGGKRNSGRLILKAPADGNVLEMHAVKGEVADTNASLVTIGDNRALWVWADLYENDYPHVLEHHQQGTLNAMIYVKAFGKTGFPGVLDYISPAMSERSRTIKLRIAVENIQSKLLAGMFAEIALFLPISNNNKLLSVPADSVLTDDGVQFVFVHHHDEYYIRRQVATGQAFGNWIEIVNGLSEGVSVVANGSFLLKSDVLRAKMGAGCAH